MGCRMIFHSIGTPCFINVTGYRITNLQRYRRFDLRRNTTINVTDLSNWNFLISDRKPPLIRNLATTDNKEWRFLGENPDGTTSRNRIDCRKIFNERYYFRWCHQLMVSRKFGFYP